MKLVHWWNLTPSELFLKHTIVADALHATLTLERTPFVTTAAPLDYIKGLDFQIGLSDVAVNHEVRAMRADNNWLPTTGDRRSGIVVLSGSTIVANFVLTGHSPTVPYMRLVVAEPYRRLGLARWMLAKWGANCKRQHDGTRESAVIVTATTARVLLDAHEDLVRARVNDVSPTVLESVNNGFQRAEILKHAARIGSK